MVKCSDRVISALVTSESNSNLSPRRQSLGDFGKYFKDFNPSMSLDCGKKPSKLPAATFQKGTNIEHSHNEYFFCVNVFKDSGSTTCFTIMKPSSDFFFYTFIFFTSFGKFRGNSLKPERAV